MSEIIMSRTHRHYAARIDQLRNNLLALSGGRPYIDARLHRAPNESEISWNGSDKETIPGRRKRAYLVNDAGRVASKIVQYLFASKATRDGIDVGFSSDVSTTGLTIERYWQEVCDSFTGGQWVWLHADRGAPMIDNETGKPTMRTLAQRDAAGDRVYWSIWSSAEVVDWCFDAQGKLRWLLCEYTDYRNDDPLAEPKELRIRQLWRRGDGGGATWERWSQDEKGKAEKIASGSISIQDVPFVLLGMPSGKPWWFDDIEMIQCALLNLGSLNHENLVKTVYPQLVIPSSMASGLEAKMIERYGTDQGAAVVELVRELIRGLDRPFIETPEDNGLTRYLQPSAQDLKAIPEEEDRRRKHLFDVAGLALFNRETRQVQTVESKQFDHLDTNSTLRNRALLMQEAEAKLVELSRQLDSSFKAYTPMWPQDFDVPNTAEDVTALTQIGNFIDLPPTMRKQVLKTVLKMLDQIEHVAPEDRKAIMDEIKALGEGEEDDSDPAS